MIHGAYAVVLHRVQDEGGARRVRKLGLLSRAAGAAHELTIGPLLPNVSCAIVTAMLGYLHSWRPEFGAFRLRCSGCVCTRVPGVWASDAYQFSTVDTRHVPAANLRAERGNATVTRFTRFHILLGAGAGHASSGCFVHVAHLGRARGAASRVRIDSFSVRASTARQVCWAAFKGARLRVRAWVGHNATRCASGAAAGRPGHLGPAALIERDRPHGVNTTASKCKENYPYFRAQREPVFDRKLGSWVLKD